MPATTFATLDQMALDNEVMKDEITRLRAEVERLRGQVHALKQNELRNVCERAELKYALKLAMDALRLAGDEPSIDKARSIADAAIATIDGVIGNA